MLKAETFTKLRQVLEQQGVHALLRLLNSRTPHRFTGVYRFDGPMLRNLYLVDSYMPHVERGEDAPMEATYCSIVGRTSRPFFTEDTRGDGRLEGHPARGTVISYCGVLLEDARSTAFGTLCHFDTMPCEVPLNEIPVMQEAARLLGPLLTAAR